MQLRGQFKLETTLLRWRTNFLELRAPGGFSFACADELAIETYVTPAGAILPANVARFQDLNSCVVVPPTRGVEIYETKAPPRTAALLLIVANQAAWVLQWISRRRPH